ncbi:MAG: NapC/NirT family cytochrome c [Gammaproteobacteria bacterium]|nr:NapC/NirT family cytochrome c [Gammaproteobacteria bacterium]
MYDLYRQLLSRKIILGTTVGAAIIFMITGVIFWGGFNTAMEATNSLEFCITCHEMEDNVYQEYKKTIHYTNRSGVRATCSDCHVPRPWEHKVVRKIQASNEVLHKILGSIDTPEKFDAKRLKLAKNVWRTMKETDSRECRNCHDFDTMNPENQKPRSRKQHLNAMKAGNTCIDCHKGIAHSKVHDQLSDEELDALAKPNPDLIRPMAPQWQDFIDGKSSAAEEPAAAAEVATETAETAETTETASAAATETTAAPETTSAAAPATATGGDWNGVPSRDIVIFYPGQASMEWVLRGKDHGGARPFKAGDRCFDCHDEEAADMGNKIASGEKAEPTPIPGKRGSIKVNVQARHDTDNLYLRFQWPDGKHTPAPFVEGGKMDPDNRVKLALMLSTDDVEYADRAGCWGTCHADLRSMPFAPEKEAISGSPLAHAADAGITKYLTESRESIETRGRDGKALGGWDKLNSDEDIKAAFDAGSYMDIIRYKLDQKVVEDGHILKDRVINDGQGAEFNATLNNGTWTVEMTRKLKSDKPGDISLDTGAVYNFGFAIHDDYTTARFHHVSLGYKLGFDNGDVEINAVKQ